MFGDSSGYWKRASVVVHISSCCVPFNGSRGCGEAGKCVLWCYDRELVTAAQRRKKNHKDRPILIYIFVS